jgi:hypothetical protein
MDRFIESFELASQIYKKRLLTQMGSANMLGTNEGFSFS